MVKKAKMIDQIMYMSLFSTIGIIINNVLYIYHSLLFDAYAFMHAKLLQSCLTLCNPLDCRFSGSSVHGILQARILESVVISSSRGSS